MSNIYGAETQLLGGGFGGWGGGYGGYGCGIAPVGLFGLFGGFGGCGLGNGFGHGHGHNDCCGKKDTEIILEDAHYNSLQNSIGQVKTEIGVLGASIGDKFALTNQNITNVGYQVLSNAKDIIHNEDKGFCATNHNIDNKFFALSKQISDCCCEQKELALLNTQKIIDKLTATELAELRERLCKCEKENDLFRFNGAIAANFASFKAATAGSNFNTGTQTQSTSNNSGQQIGA